ncbi:MAG: biotin/lipoyl-binding protein [Halieaceae bacterium]|nr:biotin/lipoyl-binding protein [Halieaceae bacterium]
MVGVLTACLASTGTLMATAPKHDPNAAQETSWPVTSFTTEVANISPELHLFGRIETPHHARLSAAIQAEVLHLHIREGQHVTRGELLVSLDRSEEDLRLQQKEAELVDSEAQLQEITRDITTDQQVLAHMLALHKLTESKAQRLQTLNNKHLIATEQLENTLQEVARQGIELARQQALVDNGPQRQSRASAAVASANAAYENQRLNLDRTEIRAPFDGRVSGLLVSPGDRVQQGQALLSLYDINALQVRVPIPSSAIDIMKQALETDTPITARLQQSKLQVTLVQLASEIDRGKSGVDGIFTVVDETATLELGRAVNLSIALPQVANVIAVPLLSIYDNIRVYSIEEGRLHSIPIEPVGRRISHTGDLEVLVSADLLKPGLAILATDLPKATSGLKVHVINEAEAQVAAESDPIKTT